MKRVMSVLLAMALVLSVAAVASYTASADVMLYGDVNSDGDINNRDLALLQQHINGWDVTADLVASDVNDDGDVNNRDLALLQQYINGWDVQLGPDLPEEPPVELPPVGYDLDGKGCILVDAISVQGSTLTVTLRNHSSQWMTEETSRVAYTCTDAEGNELTLNDKYYGVLYMGMLEANDVDTYTITLPEGTVKFEFGENDIVYWNQWIPLD